MGQRQGLGPRYRGTESPRRLSSPKEGIDKGLGRPDKKLGVLKLSSVSGLELEGSARAKMAEAKKVKAEHENNSRFTLSLPGNLLSIKIIISKVWQVSKEMKAH